MRCLIFRALMQAYIKSSNPHSTCTKVIRSGECSSLSRWLNVKGFGFGRRFASCIYLLRSGGVGAYSWRNLIDNALKYTERGAVLVSLEIEGERIVIAVTGYWRRHPSS